MYVNGIDPLLLRKGGVQRRGRAGYIVKPRPMNGQSMIEMAMCFPLFLLALLGALDAAIWSVQTDAAVSTAEAGVRIAAAAQGAADATSTSTTADVVNQLGSRLRAAMFGTNVKAWPGAVCPTSYTSLPSTTVFICVQRVGPLVKCEVIGYASSLVPPGLGLGWRGGQIPIFVGAESYALTFAS